MTQRKHDDAHLPGYLKIWELREYTTIADDELVEFHEECYVETSLTLLDTNKLRKGMYGLEYNPSAEGTVFNISELPTFLVLLNRWIKVSPKMNGNYQAALTDGLLKQHPKMSPYAVK